MPANPAADQPPSRYLPLIVATALFMENLDSTVISTSLPRIAVDLATDPIHLKLALTSYLLALAVFIPASGWMADRYGARRIFRLAIVVFAGGSIACGAATTLGWLVGARVLQGIGGAMMVPVARLIVLRTTDKAGLVNALAWLTVPALIGPVMGPPLGGFITTYFDWRWIFWINLPIAVLGVVLVTLFVPPIREDDPGAFDTRGFLMLGPGLALFLTGITLTGLGLAPVAAIAGLIAVGAALVAGYAVHALRVTAPLIDLRLLALPSFRVAVLGGFLFRVGAGATPFLLPLLLQLGFGFSPLKSGLLTFVTGIGAITMKFLAQRILTRFGFRRVLALNALIAAGFLMAPIGFAATSPALLILTVLFLGGISRSLQFTAVNALTYAEVPQARMSSATGFNSVMQQLSSSVGISVAAIGLQTQQYFSGSTGLTAASFPPVFLAVGLIAALAALWFLRLGRDAGSALLVARPLAP